MYSSSTLGMFRALATPMINLFDPREDVVNRQAFGSEGRCGPSRVGQGLNRLAKKAVSSGFRGVSASGDHFKVGESLGKQCKDIALKMERRFRERVSATPGRDMKKAVAYARRSLPLSR